MPSRSRSRSRSPEERRRSRTPKSRSRSRGRGRDHSRSPMSNRRRHDGNRDAPDKSKCIGVFGLSLYTTERELDKAFGKYGTIERTNVVLDGHSGRSRGFAFIYYEEVDDAVEARSQMNGTEMDGRKIRVDFSITKRAHTPTPGMYMGRPTRDDRRGPPPRSGGGHRDRDRGGGGRRDDFRRRRSPSPYRRRSRSYSPRRRERY